MQQAEATKPPQSNLVNVEICQEPGVSEVMAECVPPCDCSKCDNQDLEVLAVTRSKAKLKSPLDWEEQKDVRDEVTEEILDVQEKEQNP